jgi:hypothetical protein
LEITVRARIASPCSVTTPAARAFLDDHLAHRRTCADIGAMRGGRLWPSPA